MSTLPVIVTAPTSPAHTISSRLLARLSRVTSSGRFIPEIDGLRFIAILSVFIYHSHHIFFESVPGRAEPPTLAPGTFWSIVNDLMLHGWFGVELFFVISAFILGLPFAEQFLTGTRPVSLKKYLLRRVTRLEPTYLINLAIVTLLWITVCAMPIGQYLLHAAISAVYLHNAVFQRGSLINDVAWSLEIEVQFYLLAPLLARIFLVRNTWLRRGILLAAIMLCSFREEFYPIDFLGLTVAGQLKYFLTGFLLVDVYLVTWKKTPAHSYLWDLIGLAAWAALPLLVYDARCVNRPLSADVHGRLMTYLSPLVILTCYLAAFRGRILSRFFSFAWITTIGGMCYTIYLYHNLCLVGLSAILAPVLLYTGPSFLVRIALQITFFSLGTFALCSLLFALFERPFMNKDWPARFTAAVRRRMPGRTPAVPPPAVVPVTAAMEPANQETRTEFPISTE